MDFGIMFFSDQVRTPQDGKYDLVLQVAKFADEHGFCCVWTPERHFDRFGGIFPNPSVMGAALAMITSRIQIRAGSVIPPLHNPIRIAEEWSVVDNLSHGRVGLAFGSGWHANDFLFYPERYANRREIMYQQIATIQQLWAGEPITQTNSYGMDVAISLHPQPIQPRLPIWLTAERSPETFIRAGSLGANVMTYLVYQDVATLAERIREYKQARRRHGFDPEQGIISVMLHTLLGLDHQAIVGAARPALREYLRSAVNLENKSEPESAELPEDLMEELLDTAVDRYLNTAALIGSPEQRHPLIKKLKAVGVNEIACLLDFVPDRDVLIQGLPYLKQLKELVASEQ